MGGEVVGKRGFVEAACGEGGVDPFGAVVDECLSCDGGREEDIGKGGELRSSRSARARVGVRALDREPSDTKKAIFGLDSPYG